MVPAPVPSPTVEASLTAAMSEVEAFALNHIMQRAFWRFFTATASNQQSQGMWQLIRPGLQVVLMEVPNLPKPKTTSWITRPTGIVVIDGTYDGLTKESPSGSNGFLQLYTGHRRLITEPLQYSIGPVLAPCSLLITRLFPFHDTPTERARSHTIERLGRDQADALYAKMLRILVG